MTLALCQDTQAEAFDYPESFFAPRTWRIRRPPPDAAELADAVALLATLGPDDRRVLSEILTRRVRAAGRDRGSRDVQPTAAAATPAA